MTLNRELGNVYDRNAIAAHTLQGNHIVYIPRTDNAMLARMMDQGRIIVGRIAQVNHDAPAWERVAVRLFVNASAATIPYVIIAEAYFAGGGSWEEAKTRILSSNALQSRSASSAVRMERELRQRLFQ